MLLLRHSNKCIQRNWTSEKRTDVQLTCINIYSGGISISAKLKEMNIWKWKYEISTIKIYSILSGMHNILSLFLGSHTEILYPLKYTFTLGNTTSLLSVKQFWNSKLLKITTLTHRACICLLNTNFAVKISRGWKNICLYTLKNDSQLCFSH